MAERLKFYESKPNLKFFGRTIVYYNKVVQTYYVLAFFVVKMLHIQSILVEKLVEQLWQLKRSFRALLARIESEKSPNKSICAPLPI